MLKKQLVLSVFICLASFGSAQISIINTMTPAELVQNILLGSGVTATNIKYNGSTIDGGTVQTNVTQFGTTGTTFPISGGVLLTTGAGTVAIGPNSSSSQTDMTGTTTVVDADLSSIATSSITNGVILEFDFTASGDTVKFTYMFASEEYPEYSPSTFNDAFAFFLSGPGIAGSFSGGGVNLALLPTTSTSTNVVTINNVNPTTNLMYYVANDLAPYAYGNEIQFDGSTVELIAKYGIQCGQTYHIKLCISNVGDQSLDSGVFLKAGSFSANTVNVQATTSTGTPTDSLLMAEGCTSAEIMFIRPVEDIDTAEVFYLNGVGTIDATADLVSYQDSIYFPIGVDTVTFIFNPINDGIIEPMELLTIQVFSITACGDTLYDSVRLYVVDPIYPDMSSMPAQACNPDGSVTATPVNGIGTVSYAWTGPGPENTDTVFSATYNNIPSGWYYLTLSDEQCTVYDSVFVDMLNSPNAVVNCADTVGSTPATFTFTNGSTNATTYLWDFNSVSPQVNATDLSSQTVTFPTSGQYVITLVAYLGLCSDTDNITVTILDLPVATAPNVFTPNGDALNDVFLINTQNVTNVQLTITNRWGNVVFEQSNANPIWSGVVDGELASSGVYFYIFTATGVNGDKITGQGFVELIR